jgi:hypothetical protein
MAAVISYSGIDHDLTLEQAPPAAARAFRSIQGSS